MNEIVLHPSRNFLDARNPSSPFQYRQQATQWCWNYIDQNFTIEGGLWALKINDGINDFYYFEKSRQELFNSIKHHFSA